MDTLLKTPLNDWHKSHGAKMVPFAGWEMPVQYESIVAEHLHTRSEASVFDICHMGEFHLQGAGARQGLERVLTHNLRTLPQGRCRYGFMLTPEGTVQDDMIVYFLAEDEYMIVVNGACKDSDFAWLADHLPQSLHFTDISEDTAKIDLQGPQALGVLEGALGGLFRNLPYFGFTRTEFAGSPLLVSRTGYTGELGYELYLDAGKAIALWERLLEDPRVKPAGLGARDTLRLEMGLPLYGSDLDAAHTPFEAGLEMFCQSPAEFIGKDQMTRVRERRVALAIPERRSARHHDQVLAPSGEPVGVVTSGSFAPSLGHSVALAYVAAEHAGLHSFQVRTARASLEAHATELPFYKRGTARVKIA